MPGDETRIIKGRDTATGLPRVVSITDDRVLVDGTISESWRVDNVYDTDANDSNKVFTVPANTEWQVLFVGVTLATSADAGARQLEVRLERPVATIRAILARPGTTQAASLTRYYVFAGGLADLLAFRDTDWISTPIANGLLLQAGDVLRIWDNNAIAAGADDMTVHLQIAVRTI